MPKVLNTIFNIMLGLLPWGNVLSTFCIGIQQKKKKLIAVSTIFLILELALFIDILGTTSFDDLFKLKIISLIIFMVAAWLFSTSVFSSENKKNAFPQLIVAMISGVLSFLLVVINVVNIFLAFKERKYLWALPQLLIIGLVITVVLNILPMQYLSLVILLNFTTTVLWLFLIKKDWLEFSWINSFFQGSSSSSSLGGNSQVGKTGSPIVEEATVAQNRTLDKGWTVDDTSGLNINLLTVEDVIFPITVMNEYEKSAKDLIVFMCKVSRANNSNESLTQSSGELSIRLESFFKDVKLDFVRSAYIQALQLLLKDCSRQDSTIEKYVEKVYVAP